MNLKKRIDELAAKLLKAFPEAGGNHAVVFGEPPRADIDDGRQYGNLNTDERPEFIKDYYDGWEPFKR